MSVTDFDVDPLLFNVLNGTIDLRNGGLRGHRREDYITKLAPISYDPAAKCDLWDAFLRRITDGNKELLGYLKRLVGYLLTGLTTEQVLHFLFGLGANGKSVFIEIVRALLGGLRHDRVAGSDHAEATRRHSQRLSRVSVVPVAHS